jgi:serine/threonine-protein kinase
MPLTAGERLGPYEIIALIGAGGMGEVYRARDPRLGRDVAIKVSAERFSERFDREARAVAALNHPNICTLYDVGPNYLVMEYIEGEAPKGPLPLEEVLRIARQMGDALEEAHGKGIVHRDLKPTNIKIKPDGSVKVLDFGLAKLGPVSVGDSENSPTLSMAATQVGMILGTAGYMSPEQARGKVVDKRADIWAFGVVVHELLTGRKLFAGEDVTSTLAKVIEAEPSWGGVPPKVQRLLKSCLEKDPKRRLRDIADAWRLLDDVPSGPAREGGDAWLWPGVAAALAVLVGVALWAPWRSEKPVERPLVRLDVDLGLDVSLPSSANAGGTYQISPDGTRLVYLSGNPVKLYIRRLDQSKSTELPGTSGAYDPFFSPDGQWVAFFSGNKLNKISVEGGAVVPLGDFPTSNGAAWSEDGSIIVGMALTKGLVRIPSGGGGTPTTLTELANGEIVHGIPQVLPGGKAVLFTTFTVPPEVDKASIDVVTLADRRRKTIVRGAGIARYLATSAGAGHLIYSNRGTLFAVPFDPDKLETRGTAIPVLDDLAYSVPAGVGGFDVSRNGTLVYRRGSGGGGSATMTIQWLEGGKRRPLLATPGNYQNPRLSPDGKRLSLIITEGSSRDIWVYDIQRDAKQKLTSGVGTSADPIWSPDGRYIVFGSLGSGIFWTRADGASQPQPLTQSKALQVPWSFSPDAKRVAYMEIGGSPQIWTIPMEEKDGQLKAGKPEQFLKSQSQELFPAFSPDGKWLAYSSDNSGKPEIEVRAFPPPASGQGGKWLVSNSGGQFPLWSRTSQELFYLSGDDIMAVSYSVKGDSFIADKPRVWAAKTAATWLDLAPDGKRAVVLTPVAAPETPKQEHEIAFLENFFDELRRRVPLGK